MIENRDYKRAVLVSKIDYYSDTKATARNISESGLCMITQTSLSKGIPLILKFELKDKGCINTIGKIIRCQHIESNSFECAVMFSSMGIIDRQKIREYVYEYLKDKTDRRHDYRTKIDIDIDYALPVKSSIKNYNSKGLCIMTKQAFMPGSLILLTLSLPENEKIHVYGKVAWCHETKSGLYKTGITFTDIDDDTRCRIMVFFRDYQKQKQKI
ncbi:MAG: PilZ domain-containing protein [Spirochaetales bacterium]|nr:PilZ domain-containing protein [Spirochaetales bacterium]